MLEWVFGRSPRSFGSSVRLCDHRGGGLGTIQGRLVLVCKPILLVEAREPCGDEASFHGRSLADSFTPVGFECRLVLSAKRTGEEVGLPRQGHSVNIHVYTPNSAPCLLTLSRPTLYTHLDGVRCVEYVQSNARPMLIVCGKLYWNLRFRVASFRTSTQPRSNTPKEMEKKSQRSRCSR